VLGVAAVAASIARPPENGDGEPSPSTGVEGKGSGSPTASARPHGGPVPIGFRAAGPRASRRLTAGRPAAVTVSVDEPGEVAIPSLGLVETADPVTPARFDVLVSDPGSHRIELDPASPDRPDSLIGTLRIVKR
jgi:hypothetical protein